MKNGIVIVNRTEEETNVTYFDREQVEFARLNALVQKRWDDRARQNGMLSAANVDQIERKREKQEFVIKSIFKILFRIAQIWITCMFMSEKWIAPEVAVFMTTCCVIMICVQIGRCIERLKKDG